MFEFMQFVDANLFWIIPSAFVAVFGLSRLTDGAARMAMAGISLTLFAIFMIFMAFRVPSPDLVFFLLLAVALAIYDYVWATKHGKS